MRVIARTSCTFNKGPKSSERSCFRRSLNLKGKERNPETWSRNMRSIANLLRIIAKRDKKPNLVSEESSQKCIFPF